MDKQAITKDVKHYKELKKVAQSFDFQPFFDEIIKTTAQKMFLAFSSDQIKNWDDFCKVRGEVIAYLYPLQEVKGADEMVKRLEEQLTDYYGIDN